MDLMQAPLLHTVQEPESFNPQLPALRQGPLAIDWPPFDLRKSTLYMGPDESRFPSSPNLTKPTVQQCNRASFPKAILCIEDLCC